MLILHSADWHVKDQSIEECRKVLGEVRESADEKIPDLTILAGDLTHRYDVKLDSETARLIFDSVSHLGTIAPVVIVGGTFFHDGRSPELLSHLNLEDIYVFPDYPTQVCLTNGGRIVDIDKVTDSVRAVISIVPAPTKKFIDASGRMEVVDGEIASLMGVIFMNLGEKAKSLFPDVPHILAGHWSIGGAYISEKQQMIGRDIEISRDQVCLAKADLVCLGHIHKAQQIGKEPIFYSGSIYSLDAGELDDKGFYYHTLTKTDLCSEFVQVSATKRVVIEEDVTANGDLETSVENIIHRHSAEQIGGNIVKVTIKLFQDQVDQLKGMFDLEQHFLASGAQAASVHYIRVPRENVRCKEFFTLNSLAEKIAQQAALRAEPEIDKAILEKVSVLESLPPEKIIESLPKP